jgi:cardiolipin synthase
MQSIFHSVDLQLLNLEGIDSLYQFAGLSLSMQPGKPLQLFFEGDHFYDALMDDLRQAERSVLMEFYIFNYDHWGQRFLSVLKDLSVHHGVHVRLLLDGIGSRSSLPAIEAFLSGSGVELAVYKPLSFFSLFRSGMHRRNHRKIVLIDRRICYIGGMNIKDENSHRLFGPSRWRDTMMRIEKNDSNRPFFRFIFAGMILLFQSVRYGVYPLSLSNLLRAGGKSIRSLAFYRFRLRQLHRRSVSSEPELYTTLFRRDRAFYRRSFFRLLRSAERRIFLSSPYFVADQRMLRVLRARARSGVDVRILTAGTTDVWSARQAGRATYDALLRSGVRVFEMEGRIFHAKQSLIDDVSIVGSGNLDYRSFLHNQEVMVQSRDPVLARALALQWGIDMNEAREIHLPEWKRRSVWQKITEKLCYAFRYYL